MLSFFTLFGGLIIPFSGLAMWWKWTFYINPFAFMLEAIVAPQVRNKKCNEEVLSTTVTVQFVLSLQFHCEGDVAACRYIAYYCGTSCPPVGSNGGFISVPIETAFPQYYGGYMVNKVQRSDCATAVLPLLLQASSTVTAGTMSSTLLHLFVGFLWRRFVLLVSYRIRLVDKSTLSLITPTCTETCR